MLEKLFKSLVIKLKINENFTLDLEEAPKPAENYQIELTDRVHKLAGGLICPIDRTATDPAETIFCPLCMTPYHIDCAEMLAERNEKCWGCNKFERFDLLIKQV